ncbi:DMT family transporter [Marinobacterium sp. D7]|uniref:aromatic amino acid exporter YddG n=1 Tax=Marinobacterium ramblicola TaxID=2849041 RepID=UPI001C2D098F|nr:DMT family transporter [Marinobacterium ramblicola]MBV1786975.1 DMT family transporter [Marinobacterium ramblicola]
MNIRTATLIGSISILLWGTLALMTRWTDARIPPFQLLAMTFSLAWLLMQSRWWLRGESGLRFLRQPLPVWLLGIGGLFGYHLFYFIALAKAPAAEAGLIAYLWPLLIVLLSALLPGERLRGGHIIGALLAASGSALLLIKGDASFNEQHLAGYLAAGACALIWSCYSVLSRRHADVPTDTVGWYCAGTALLGLLCHLLFEQTVWPERPLQWVGIVGLGLGPVGIAFLTWDIGVKKGNIQLLGTLAYAAPLISTLLLILAGEAQPSPRLLLACLLIVGGSMVAGIRLRRWRQRTAEMAEGQQG